MRLRVLRLEGLYCTIWRASSSGQKDLGRQQTRNGFGAGSSPALFKETIVVNWDHEGDDFIAAFDKQTGRELWRQPRDEATSGARRWSSNSTAGPK